jgi:ABC-type transport system involved in multi-copper enzyme maturation permease subunit
MGNVAAVFAFEWKRALTIPRMIWWAVLASFPVFIMTLISLIAHHGPANQDEVWRGVCTWLIFALIPMLIPILGTLLWTTPAVSAELERRTWVYLAVRPNGATAVLLGKYLAAVTWVIPPAIISLLIAVWLPGTGDEYRIAKAMIGLVLLSCPAYAAIYTLLGVLMPRRAMVLAVAYTLLFELIISFVPAVINKMTVQYRLRALAASWCKLQIPVTPGSTAASWFGNEPDWVHITVLLSQAAVLLVIAVTVLRFSEFASSAETDT